MAPSIDVPLSVGNVRSLIKQLKQLSRELKDDIKVDIERETCDAIASDVRLLIASIPDVDGNYLGSDNPNAAVSVEVGFGSAHHQVIWRGKQIRFLEFGTGRRGSLEPYRGVAMSTVGYRPDAQKETWWYAENGQPVQAYGLTPQAPMYNAATAARVGKTLQVTSIRVVGRALDAIHI